MSKETSTTKSSATHYLAISTGPIVDTILLGQSTREVWTASYLFSTLMEQLVLAVEKTTIGGSVLAPRPPTVPTEQLFGAGVYPDRLYAAFTDPVRTMDELANEIIDAAITKTAALATAKKDQAQGIDYFRDYFRIVHVWLPAGAATSRNILQPLNDLLDTQELRPAVRTEHHLPDLLTKLLAKPYATELVRGGLVRNDGNIYAGLVEPEYKNDKYKPRRPREFSFDFFPSTFEVASLEMYYRDPANYYDLLDKLAKDKQFQDQDADIAQSETDVIETGKEPDSATSNEVLMAFYREVENKMSDYPEARALNPLYQTYHKYFCIVHADGDRFGKVIEKVGAEEEAIKTFSTDLARFAAVAAATINEYGGKPVFIGGDDLLFFAPVVFFNSRTERETTVFDLIEKLDQDFADTCKFSPQPTLSYGLTLSHYKYPLFEARDDSFDLLLMAKNSKWITSKKEKDTVTFRLIQHSGSYFEGSMDKTLLSDFNAQRKKRRENDFPSSFTYKLRELQPLVEALEEEVKDLLGEKSKKEQDKYLSKRLVNLINNAFDEPVHDSKQVEDLVEFFLSVQQSTFEIEHVRQDTRDNAYALLRLIAFTLPQKK